MMFCDGLGLRWFLAGLIAVSVCLLSSLDSAHPRGNFSDSRYAANPLGHDFVDLTHHVHMDDQQAASRDPLSELVTAQHLSFGAMLLAIAAAVALGALHGLEPGHGKTLVAAYLIGARGTPWHAVFLGLVVTVSHTAGVYLLGAVTLLASQYVVEERLYPWLGVGSGLIVLGLGVFLLVRRGRGALAHGTHDHHHERDQEHTHPHDEHGSPEPPGEPGPGRHAHAHHHHAPGGEVSIRELIALGVTGGVVPCPAALVVLLSAISLRRVGLGMLLIVAFSAGLAALLIAVGLLMVYARNLMSRFGGEGPLMTRWLPLISPVVISIFGAAMIWQGLKAAGLF